MTTSGQNSRIRQIGAELLLAIFAVITFFANNAVLVPDIMESRNLITAREMVEKQNWLLPTMNGQLRLEKPPLPTWIAATIESASPDNLGAQRMAAGCMGLLLVVFFYLYAKNRLKINAVAATLVLLTCYNVVLMGRTVSWDIYCHAFMMGGIYFLSGALYANSVRWHDWILSGLFIGLSILSKGPVSLYALLLPWIIAACVCKPVKIKGKWLPLFVMLLVALTVGCWWYGYVYIFEGNALQAVANQESGAWLNRNVRPWWYYHAFYLETGIWSLLMLTSLGFMIFRYARREGRQEWITIVWLGAGLVLLSLLPEKKTRYLLPLLLPCSLIIGQVITQWSVALREGADKSVKPERIWLGINSWLLAVVVGILPVVGYIFLVQEGIIGIWEWTALSIFFEIVAFLLVTAAVRKLPMRMLWSVALLMGGAEIFALPYIGKIVNNQEMHGLAYTVGDRRLRGIPFYYNADEKEGLRIELVYAARREIHPLDLTDSAAVEKAMPFALLSHTGGGELPKAIIHTADTTYIGLYDDNRRPKGTRRYSPLFIYHLTLVTPRNESK